MIIFNIHAKTKIEILEALPVIAYIDDKAGIVTHILDEEVSLLSITHSLATLNNHPKGLDDQIMVTGEEAGIIVVTYLYKGSQYEETIPIYHEPYYKRIMAKVEPETQSLAVQEDRIIEVLKTVKFAKTFYQTTDFSNYLHKHRISSPN